MNRFLSQRRMRNTAFTVLLAWLFAIASGVANACLLESPRVALHVSAAGTHAADVSTHVGTPARDIANSGGAMHDASPPCQKVCDDTPQSLPKAASGVDHTNPGLSPPAAILWAATAPVAVGARRMARMQPALPELPLRLRYPRLAL